jgi:hypothetical protein
MKKNYLTKINCLTSFDFSLKTTTFFKVVLFLFLLGFQNAFSQTVTYTTGSGNFTVPCDVTSITVQIWGGGGAGGGGNTNNNGGSGGGAGGFSTSTLAVTAGSTIAYSVGAGGTGNNNTGNPGGVTTFGALTANGGSGGGPNQGAIGIGGTASGGTTNTSGNNGSLGTSTIGAAGGNANGGGGSGGASRNTAGAGNVGIAPGGGGGGGFRTTTTNRAGGAGGAGEIRITYTSSLFAYCFPTFTSNVEPITNVTFAGINNTTTNATGGNALESFCNTANVTQGQTVPISVKGNTVGNFTHYFRLYVDWNKNGTFGDLANEIYDLGTITNSTGIDATVLNTTITVPALASLGLTRMRLMKRYNAYPTGACQTGAGFGQAEDYCVNVTTPPTPTITNLLTDSSGCVGSNITITGTNLSGATAADVKIGGTAVSSITSNNGSTIVAVIGAGTTGTVSVTTAGGTATSVGTFTVNPNPAAIAGGATTVCTGSNTIAFTNATAGGSWTIAGITGTATISGGGIATGVTEGTVTVVYMLPTTCSVTKALTVQQTPGTIAGGASSVCVGASTPAFTNPVAGGAWTVTNGTGTATITSPGGVLTGTSAGTVTVNYTIGSCTAATYAVTVNPTPVAIVGAATVCTGATTTLTDATAGGTWGITNGTGSATITAGGVVSAVTAGTVTASYTLSPTTCNVTRSITVQQTPGAIAGGASSVCVGSSTPAFTNPNAGGTWSVTNGTGAATITSPAGILTGTAAGTVTVRYTIGTCTAATYAVTVNPTPSTPTAPVNSAITGSGFTVTWTASAGAVNYVLEVYTNAGYTIPVAGSPFTVSSPTVSYSVTGLTGPVTYYYRIKATNVNCSSGYVTGIVTTLISNDECTGAIPLTVSTTCSYSTYTNAGATGSIGITAPGCASYNGGDVWFLAVVPATGELNIDLTQGVMTDSGLAIYSGSCGALTLLDCDDDSSSNGTMSRLSRTGLTPGQTIYIRVWEFGNNNNGTFGICVTTPSCPSPSDLYTNILSTTSVTVNWNASAPPASGGYQYFINTTGTAPTTGTTPTGTTAAGVTGVTFNGLTPGLKYYFWIRSFCGGTDVSSWYGPTNYTPCAVGSGTGTTTLGCTSPIAGGIGLSGSDPVALTCSTLTCPTLEVSYLPIKQTTDYTVTSIPTYAPPYQFTCLQNPVSVNVDDVWSPIINLPFDFCFYGNSFDKCLIGSNGVITFDTTNNTPGGYSAWSFDTNLPNASLFRNTIFGVYHDMNPSSGGQVGWELITLNTGCRALVAAWNEIPMYSSACNSMFFTGMMVLYENTNIIEVYIQEKNVCSTWNDGNAIVGVQNSTGTAAVVAPARNGLNTNWTVTNEAWRFTPNGPSINPTVQWYQGSVATGTPISGATSSSVTVCPTVSTSYTAEVTYPLCTGDFKVTDQVAVTVNGNKIWNGNTSNDWNTNSNWTPSGVPTAANCVVIPVVNSPKPYPVISNTADGVGYNLAVYNNASLTINSNKNLTITDAVTVQTGGLFTINNSASLIQINNVLNSGNITYRRESPSVRTLDYSYWSSPVANFNVSNIVLPYTFGLIYKWNTTVANANGTQGNWQWAAGNTMIPGKGYIARAPSAAPFNNTTTNILYGSFTGVPNNGTITFPIERGSDQNTLPHTGTNGVAVSNYSDNWNLLGNPYPSAISGGRFLYDNRTKIEGNIRLWTHGQLPTNPTNPFYGTFLYNYFGADYLEYNYTGMSCCPSAANDLYIGAGQGFFVQMVDGPQSIGVESVTFTNNLRSVEFDNSTFFKTPNLTTDTAFDVNEIERNRIWLDIVNSTNQSHRTLFGYIENATMGKDSFYDCATQITNGPLIYSLINDDLFSIQGRSLPFEINDEVPIGVNIPTQGNYSIAIAGTDGLFASQDIYLKDNLLNITHDLKISPYQFTPEPGVINNRFKVVYINNALGTNNPNEITTYATISNNTIVVESNDFIKAIDLYDVTGKHVNRYSLTEIKKQFSDVFNYPNGVYIVKITFDNDMVVSKKLIH